MSRQESELVFVCFFTFKRKERRKMLISILFVGIIIVYGFIGLKNGGIKRSQFQVLCKPSLWCRIEIH